MVNQVEDSIATAGRNAEGLFLTGSSLDASTPNQHWWSVVQFLDGSEAGAYYALKHEPGEVRLQASAGWHNEGPGLATSSGSATASAHSGWGR